MNILNRFILLSIIFLFICLKGSSQTITGAWKGKINTTKVELKLIKSGDSLIGTVYYYLSKTNFRRYTVKGYFDGATNDVVWWDDCLIEDHAQKNLTGSAASGPRLTIADFNCPGEDEMLLDGNSTLKDDIESAKNLIHLQKSDEHIFNDDWDWVIENYTVGANIPSIIDSINQLQGIVPFPEEKELIVATAPKIQPSDKSQPVVKANPPVAEKTSVPLSIKTPEEKFASRKNIVQTVIPVSDNKIELHFYDNAQVDGDSIALFLNNQLLFKNIRLTDKAYTIFLNAAELKEDNELVMVAENLGSIPPNTSFMVAIVGDKRYEARLYANENSSAVIRLVKKELDLKTEK
ncbi:MAG: hypothetical protein ACKVOW_18260 [Chitinophagaceae bacterium]